MSNLTSVGVTSGVPTSGTGTVSTIDNLLALGSPISDGTTNLVAVKAASTAPTATDKALVVAMSPNSVNANGQATMANSAPVVIASNQSSIAVTPAALVAGSAVIGKVSVDQTTPGTTNLVQVPSTGHTGSATFTTGTTVYAANDVVGASAANAAVDFGVCGISGNNILITSVELEIDSASIIAGETSYNLYLYNVTPASAINDSSPFTLGAGDRAAFLGKIALPGVSVEGVTTATLYCAADGINKHVKLSGTDLFGYLTSVGAFTPTARVYKITVHTIDL